MGHKVRECLSSANVQVFRILKRDISIQVSFFEKHLVINWKTVADDDATNQEDEVAPSDIAPIVNVAIFLMKQPFRDTDYVDNVELLQDLLCFLYDMFKWKWPKKGRVCYI